MSEQEWIDIFADNLVGMLKEYGMTQGEFAEAIGVSDAAVSGYINKKKMPGIKTLLNMSYLFGCTIDDLVDFGDKIR